jgi:hypothetical protein
MDMSNNLGGFAEQQQQRPAAPFIDPSFLTANAVQRHTPESAQGKCSRDGHMKNSNHNLAGRYPYLRQENVHPQSVG